MSTYDHELKIGTETRGLTLIRGATGSATASGSAGSASAFATLSAFVARLPCRLASELTALIASTVSKEAKQLNSVGISFS